MTSPNGEMNGDGYRVGGTGVRALTDLNNLSEAEAKRRLRAPVEPSFNRHRDGVWDNNRSLLDVILGRYNGTIPEFVDGQIALNDKVALLKDNGYCSLTLSTNVLIPGGLNRALPFNAQIGPKNKAEPVTVTRNHGDGLREERCIRLDREGLWQANLALVQNQASWESFAEIMVLRPDFTEYTVLSLPTPNGVTPGTAGGNDGPSKGAPISLCKLFVIPEPGYFVQVRYACFPPDFTAYHPRIRGGAKYANFSVTQWSSDVAAVGAPESSTTDVTLA